MRWIVCICIMAALGSCKEEVYFIPGSATLPDCNDTPVTDLNGTLWFDQGTVTIVTEGCTDAAPDDTFASCALNWAFTQDGNDVTILVDEVAAFTADVGHDLWYRLDWWCWGLLGRDLGCHGGVVFHTGDRIGL